MLLKRIVVVLGTLLGTLLTAASPALAQVAAGGTAHVPGASPPPQYVLAADGTLTTGGDVVLNCNEVARFVEQYGDDPPSDSRLRSELEQARGVVEQCERIGFSPSGGTGTGPIGPSGVENAEGTPVGGVTEDGFVRTRDDTFVACDSGFPVVEQYAEACEKPGSTTVGQGQYRTPSGSEGEEDSAALSQQAGGPPVDPEDYVFEEGGSVIIDGDQGMSCRDFAMTIPRADASSDLEQARDVLEQCEQAGLLPPGETAPSGIPTTRAELPATGGLALLPSLAALLVVSGALVAVVWRRTS